MSKNMTYRTAVYFKDGIQTDGKILINAASAAPTSATSYGLYMDSLLDLYWWDGSTSTKLNGSSGGGGVAGSLDDAYSLGRAVTLDEGAITFTDAGAAALNSIEFIQSGAKSGNILDFAINAALTGNVLDLDMNLGIAAGAIYIDNGATARTGSDIQVKDDSTGNHSVINIDKSGSGASIGFDYQESYNGSSASFGAKFTLDNSDGIDTTAIQIVRGTGLRTVPAIDINDASTGNTGVIDIDHSGVYTGNSIDIAYAGAATGNAIFINLDNAVAGTGLHIEGSGVRTEPMVEIITDSTSSASLIDISVDGAITGTAAIDIDMNLGLAANAIYIDAGGGIRTADEIAVKHDGSGNVDVFSVVSTNTGSGSIFDINMDGIGSTGGVFNVDMNAAVGATVFTLDAGGGTRTVDMIDVTFDGDGNVGFLDINCTNTGSGNLIDIDIDGIHTGKIISITYGTAASTGDAIELAMGTNVSGSALVITAAGARTDDLIKIDDSSTSNSPMFDINYTGINTGNCLDITYSVAAATGNAINITTGTNVAGNAISITTAGIRTAPVINIVGAATDAGTDDHIIFVTQSGQLDSNIIQLTYDTAASTGDAIGVTMGTNVSGSALVVSATGARTDDLIKIDSDHTDAGLIFDINISGASTGNVFDLTYSVGANSGNAISLAMGTNVAGQAIVITSAATGVSAEGSAIDIAHTGDLVAGAELVRIVSTGNHDATSNVVHIEQTTGAGAAGTNLLYLNATGANVEAIEIAAGVLFEAEVTATPGSGNGETLPITGNTIFYDPNGGSRTGVIVTAGLRDGQRVTIVNIADAAETITFAASGTSNVAGGASVSIARYECLTLIWNAATSLWYCMGAGL